MLANPFEKETPFLPTPTLKLPKNPKEIVIAASQDKMIKEIERHLLDDEKPSIFINELKSKGLLNRN